MTVVLHTHICILWNQSIKICEIYCFYVLSILFSFIAFFFYFFSSHTKGCIVIEKWNIFQTGSDRNRFKICMALTQLDKHWKAQIKLNNFDKKNYLLNYQKFTAIPLFGLTKRPDLSLWRLLVSKMFHFSMTMQNAPYHTYQYDIPLKSWWSFLHWIIIFHHLKKKKNLRKRNRTFSCAWCAVCSFR